MHKIHSSVKKDLATGCWVWIKSKNSAGYGQLTVDKKYWTAHRYSYTKSKGEIPIGVVVRHTCHNPACCNPDHLVLGSDLDNYHDSLENHKLADSKRRSVWQVGDKTYTTCREVVEALGISMGTVIKYTDDGVFDINAYRQGCKKANVKPKI